MNNKAVISYLRLAIDDYEMHGDTIHLLHALDDVREIILESGTQETPIRPS